MMSRLFARGIARTAALALTVALVAVLVPSAALAGPVPVVAAPSARSGDARVLARPEVPGVHALADADSDIPGAITLYGTSGTRVATLNASGDADDVYKVTLAAGDVLLATIKGPSRTQFDLWLYAPTATSIHTSSPVWFSNAEDVNFAYPIELEIGVERPLEQAAYGKNEGDIFPAGTYYLDCWAGAGSGAYTLTWQIIRFADVNPANNDIPGATAARPQYEWVSDLWDADDVFAITLAEGDQLDVSLVGGDANLLADAFLFRPTAGSVMTDYFTAWTPLDSGSYPATFSYVVPKGGGGTYYVDIVALLWSGPYSFQYAVTPDPAIVRLAGASRFDTAQVITRSSFPTATVGVIATGMGYADALSAAGLAGAYDAPLLLVGQNTLPDAAVFEMLSLGVTKVYIVGGTGAISSNVERTLSGTLPWLGGYLSFTTERIAGANRYDTAAKVAEKVIAKTGATSGFLVRGDGFADALAVSPLAYTQGMPILLTQPRSLDVYAHAVIENRNLTSVYIAGGAGAVSAATEAKVRSLNGGATSVTRAAGINRYDTAWKVANLGVSKGWNNFGFVAVATGANFPDALSGGVGAGNWGGVLLLTTPTRLSGECATAIREHLAQDPKVAVLGGPGAVSAGVYTSLKAIVQ